MGEDTDAYIRRLQERETEALKHLCGPDGDIFPPEVRMRARLLVQEAEAKRRRQQRAQRRGWRWACQRPWWMRCLREIRRVVRGRRVESP